MLQAFFPLVEVVMKLFPDLFDLAAQLAIDPFEIVSKFCNVYFPHVC
jgi:hypothetical protein